MLLSDQADVRRGVHFSDNDNISRAVQRLDKLAAYDDELEKWSKSRQTTERSSLSARERKNQIKTLEQQDRSKSVPSEKDVGIFRNLGIQNPRFQKKTYGEELRRQMEEQRQAKANAKKEYIGLPTTRSNAKGPIVFEQSPMLDAEEMMRLPNTAKPAKELSSRGVTRQAVVPIREVGTPSIQPQPHHQTLPPAQPNPHTAPLYPGYYPNFMFPPPGMYPPYPLYFPHPQYQPEVQKNYDPYSYYGLDKRKSSVSQEKLMSPPSRLYSKPLSDVEDKPKKASVVRIADIGGSDYVKSRQTKVPDSLEYARELKRQMEERERQREQRKRDDDDYNRRIEAEAQSYNPWGRGGAGAPLKDASGNPLPTRRANQSEPEHHPAAAVSTESTHNSATPKWHEDRSIPSTITPKTSSQHFGRVNEITGQSKANDPQILAAKNDYQAFLKQQMEEKNAKKEKEKELQRLEDEREAARIERDRVRMKEEFEKELEEKKQKEESQRRANEELKRVAEERRKEQERRAEETRKNAEEERKRQLKVEQEERKERREPSPPLPTLARARSPPFYARSKSPPIPTLAKPSKPIETLRNESRVGPVSKSPALVVATPELSKTQVMNQLSALREQLNRLQNVKREQNETGKVVKMDDEIGPVVRTPSVRAFETALQKAAKYRPPPHRPDSDIIFDELDRKNMFKEDSLDNQCSSEFIPCATETPSSRTDMVVPRINNRYNRPPSVTSITSFDVHEIAQRNEERLRRLEEMHSSDNILSDRTPSGILEDFLNVDSGSLHCDTSFKPVI